MKKPHQHRKAAPKAADARDSEASTTRVLGPTDLARVIGGSAVDDWQILAS